MRIRWLQSFWLRSKSPGIWDVWVWWQAFWSWNGHSRNTGSPSSYFRLQFVFNSSSIHHLKRIRNYVMFLETSLYPINVVNPYTISFCVQLRLIWWSLLLPLWKQTSLPKKKRAFIVVVQQTFIWWTFCTSSLCASMAKWKSTKEDNVKKFKSLSQRQKRTRPWRRLNLIILPIRIRKLSLRSTTRFSFIISYCEYNAITWMFTIYVWVGFMGMYSSCCQVSGSHT